LRSRWCWCQSTRTRRTGLSSFWWKY